MSATSRKNNIRPTVLDIFCGAGGMSLGFKQAGCEILGGIDHNHHAIKTHHRNFPKCKLKIDAQDIRDIEDLSFLDLEPHDVDILIGGPPCQVFSRVGIGKMKKLGRNIEQDHRNFLYKEFVRFLNYFQPLYFVMENVDHLAKKQDKISVICNDLKSGINHKNYPGYDIDVVVLNSSDFGVPQKRKRLFIIGKKHTESYLSFPVFKPQKTIITIGEAVSDLPPLEPFSMPLKRKSSGPKQKDCERPYASEAKSKYQKRMRRYQRKDAGVWNHLCRSHNEEDIRIFSIMKQGDLYRDLPLDVMRYRVDIFDDKYKRLKWDEPSWTLTAHMRKDGLAYIHPIQDRSISVREAARLQSFPDNFIFDAPMTRMFELVGNSVPPLLAKAVAIPLVKSLREQNK